jgi:hypothetical protein
VTALATRPGDRAVALTRFDARSGKSTVELVDAGLRGGRLLFAGGGPLGGVAWSPDGRLLLVAWELADQWVFVPARRGARVVAASGVTELFTRRAAVAPRGVRVEGWCCTA